MDLDFNLQPPWIQTSAFSLQYLFHLREEIRDVSKGQALLEDLERCSFLLPCANLWECADGQLWYELERSLCSAWKVWWEPRALRLEVRLTRPMAGIQPVIHHCLLHLPVWYHSNLSICPSYPVWGKQPFQSDHPFIDPLRALASLAWSFPSMWLSLTYGH